MPLRITFISSGSAFADGGRSHACIHVTAPGVSLLLDCGGSSLPAIQREVDAEAIDAIAVSHLHGDHFGGIPYLLIEQHFAGRTAPLLIGGPRALGDRLRALESSLYPDFFRRTKLGFPISEIVLGANETEFGGALVSALPVKHVAESDPQGSRSLYSAANQAPALGSVMLDCSSCLRTSTVTPRQLLGLAIPSLHLLLVKRRYPSWMRCPACEKRTWVRLAVRL